MRGRRLPKSLEGLVVLEEQRQLQWGQAATDGRHSYSATRGAGKNLCRYVAGERADEQ